MLPRNPLSLRIACQSGLRLIRTSPGVAASAIAALALGIGFTTAMFGIVHGATRPLPVSQPEEIVAIQKTASRGVVRDFNSYAFDLEMWRSASSLESLGGFQTTSLNLAGDGGVPERTQGAMISANAFAIMDFVPAFGRGFDAADAAPGAAPVVILSDALWKRRYGADPKILGRVIRIDGRPHDVVAVMPPRVGFPINASLWVPLTASAAPAPGDGPSLIAFGRLRDGADISRATAEIATLTGDASARFPESHGGIGIQILPFTQIETPMDVIQGLRILVVAVSFVMLIACANVASLLVVRGAARAREIATRIALGASRGQLVAEQLGESLTLALAASVIGLGMAHIAIRAFGVNTSSIIEAFWVDFRVDGVVVAFASMLAAIATAAAGLGPALRIARTDPIDALKDRSHGSGVRLSRLARRLPGVQIALACGLLALTMALAQAAVDLRTAHWPFDPTRILSAQYGLTLDLLDDRDRRNRRLGELLDALQGAPGVEAAALTSALPGRGSGRWSISLDAPTEPNRPAPYTTSVTMVTPGFFDLLGARPIAGRGLTPADHPSAPAVAVVNQSFVGRLLRDRDPLGARVYIGQRELTIVGVVPDLMPSDIQERTQDGLYASIWQFRPYAVRVMARGAGDPLDLVPVLRRETARVDPDLPIYETFSVRDAALRDKVVLDVISSLFLVFGAGALGLTAVGLYGVVAFAVAQRTRELGIRLALGATRWDIVRLVASQGATQIAVGLGVGIALAIGLTRAFAAAIANAPTGDAWTLAVIVASVGATAAIAMAVPARRAASLQIVRALRQD
jgi:predicted permease